MRYCSESRARDVPTKPLQVTGHRVRLGSLSCNEPDEPVATLLHRDTCRHRTKNPLVTMLRQQPGPGVLSFFGTLARLGDMDGLAATHADGAGH